jgi:type IV pilus assembly protein PilE
MNLKYRVNGFTLIEVLVVVAIVGILAAIAAPSYQSYMKDTRRSDAHTALARLAGLQERYYLQNNTYAPDIGTLNPPAPGAQSEEGYYNMTLVGNASTFTITATAAAGGPQANDAGCTVIELTQANQKTPAECW